MGDKKDKDKEPSGSKYPSIQVGKHTMYPDNIGGLHKDPSEAIAENMRSESDLSRGASGGCGQDPDLAPKGK